MVKEGGENVVENFKEKCKELKIEGKRKIVAETLYTEPEKEMLYMGTEIEARKRNQERNNRRGSSCGSSYGRGERQRSSS